MSQPPATFMPPREGRFGYPARLPKSRGSRAG